MDNEEESSDWPIVREPSWLQPYCSWCRMAFENMNVYMKHLQSQLHNFHVKVSHCNRNYLKPLGWIMPRFGDHVRICCGRYRNELGQVMRTNEMRSTLDVYIYTKSKEDPIVKDIPFYSVLKVRDGVTI